MLTANFPGDCTEVICIVLTFSFLLSIVFCRDVSSDPLLNSLNNSVMRIMMNTQANKEHEHAKRLWIV